VERLTSEQIRLLEELRELRDAGILTVEEFEFQVAKVLGRPQVVEPTPFVEEPLAPQEPDETAVAENLDEAQQVKQSDVADVALVPDTSYESELLEYELVEPGFSDEDEILVEENQVAEPPSISDTLALPFVETETQQNVPSRRKVLIGTSAGLVLIAVIGLVTLVGGGKSDSTSTQIVDSTTPFTQITKPATTEAATTSTQIIDNTTTVTQNASIGTTNQPTAPTTAPVTTTPVITTVVNSDSRRPIVTGLQISKSPSVFYDWPPDLQQTVTYTATILNDEQLTTYFQGSEHLGLAGNVRLCWKDACTMKWFSREKPGTWKVTVEPDSAGREMCVRIDQTGQSCNGPSVSYEVLVQERDNPVISQLTMTPAIVAAGDTVRISVRVVDQTGVTFVMGSLQIPGFLGDCGGGDLSLSSGNEKDGFWSIDCIANTPPGQGSIMIVAYGIYSDESRSAISFEVL